MIPKPLGLVILPDNGRDPNYQVEMGLDGCQVGTVRIFFTASDPDAPDKTIADYTGVLRPEELEQARWRSPTQERFLYYGRLYEQ